MKKVRKFETYEIYQLKEDPENQSRKFASYHWLIMHGQAVKRSNYEKVYAGSLKSGESLDSIYERFNLYHPDDFRGHSLSVSDVIVLHQNNREQAYYVDSFGFRQVPEFFGDNPLKKVEELLEDDYGMIDGIINNGDRRKDEEEKKTSMLDKIQEKKKAAVVAENSMTKPLEIMKNHEAELS